MSASVYFFPAVNGETDPLPFFAYNFYDNLSIFYVYSNFASVSLIDSIFPISCFFFSAMIRDFLTLVMPLLYEPLLR